MLPTLRFADAGDVFTETGRTGEAEGASTVDSEAQTSNGTLRSSRKVVAVDLCDTEKGSAQEV
jgi:hypothetical protein